MTWRPEDMLVVHKNGDLTNRLYCFMNTQQFSSQDKLLFTPGPLTTSRSVKQAMQNDLGSRDSFFIDLIRNIRKKLVKLGDVDENEYCAILMQGSGTFGIESVVSSVIPSNGKLLILINGAYGERIRKIADVYGICNLVLNCAEDEYIHPFELERALEEDPTITHVAVVHCETSTGLINPIDQYGEIVQNYNRLYIVDAMSSFGAYPIPLKKYSIDYLISSSNKCIEGVPGFSFIIARLTSLLPTKSHARTLSLNLYAQWEGFEKDGQFRFTPPTHAILAFNQALQELEMEGGIIKRAERYRENYRVTLVGMESLGFNTYLPPELRGYIITSFNYPDHPDFYFLEFYDHLRIKGFIIYPGKLSHANYFRIGHIGRLDARDAYSLISAVRATLEDLHIELY